MKITTQMIKELRDATGAGILEAKKILEQVNGDFDMAVDELRKKGAARAAKRADREASEGIVELYTHPGNRLGVMVELNCETDFVARNEQFIALAHDLALHIAASAPRYISKDEVAQEELDRELSVLRDQALAEGRPQAVVDKIIEGRMRKFYEEVCLLEQPFFKDESVTINQLIVDNIRTIGENIRVRRFARYALGEAL
ncbi:MAG: translation elongation factor Ts [Ardenticatenaceae bacterium]|nr:translation elongation factor Ts [Ardenticatenaceae bacterium]